LSTSTDTESIQLNTNITSNVINHCIIDTPVLWRGVKYRRVEESC
jgi:hypothetical protein